MPRAFSLTSIAWILGILIVPNHLAEDFGISGGFANPQQVVRWRGRIGPTASGAEQLFRELLPALGHLIGEFHDLNLPNQPIDVNILFSGISDTIASTA